MSALDEAFPSVEPGLIPFGSRVLVQIRSAKKTSAGGIILHTETRETEIWNTQIAKVVKLGPLAFKNRNTMESWPEGNWCKDGEEEALFVIFNDLDIVGGVVGDPLAIKAFI
jgi:co-chaperonin GroES (HSP10)